MSTLTITLAGNQYSIQTPILGQVRDVSVIVAGALEPVTNKSDEVERAWDRKLEVIAVALGRNYPDVTVESLSNMTATFGELNKAYLEILDFFRLTADSAPSPEPTQ